MSPNATIAEIAELVRTGALKEAKAQARTLLDTAEPRHLEIIARCAEITENYPRTALTRLRWMWQHADAHSRAIIAACAPAPGEDRSRPQADTERAPRWTARTRYQAPSTVTVRQGRPRRTRRPVSEPAVSVRYHETRAGIDDQPQRAERPAGYAHDYDKAAIPTQRGTACLSCWTERAAADLAAHDDGLCAECRDAGRRGIAPIPADGCRAAAIAARCAYIAANHPPATARVLLRADWEHSPQRERLIIAAWVAAHPIRDTAQNADARPEPQRPGPCQTCAEPRTLRDVRHQASDDGQCAQCRDTEPADETNRDSAPAPRVLAAVA